MRRYHTRLAVDAICSFITELLCDAHTRAFVGNHTTLAMFFAALIPVVGFFGFVWFVEEKSWWRKAGYALAGSIGYAAGTFVISTFYK